MSVFNNRTLLILIGIVFFAFVPLLIGSFQSAIAGCFPDNYSNQKSIECYGKTSMIFSSIYGPADAHISFVALSKPGGCATYDGENHVISVRCDTTLPEIAKSIGNNDVLREENGSVWVLNSSLVIQRGATLTLNSTDATWLKLSSKGRSSGIHGIESENNVNGSTPLVIQISGSLILEGVKITSWDPDIHGFATQVTDGTLARPFITIETGAGPSKITNSEIAYLGYKSVRKQGLNFYGGDGSILRGNKIHNLWFGFFSTAVGNITLDNNTIYSNARYGVDPHSGTHDMVIRNNHVRDNGHIGIICSDDCTNIIVVGNHLLNNTNAGIMLSKNVRNSTVTNNTVSGENTGISVSESKMNTVHGNDISGSTNGIQIKLQSSNNRVYNNSIYDIERCGLEITQSSQQNNVTSNVIKNSRNYGVCLTEGPTSNVLTNNTIDASGRGFAVYAKNSNSPTNVFKSNVLMNIARTPIRLVNSTLTVQDNILK